MSATKYLIIFNHEEGININLASRKYIIYAHERTWSVPSGLYDKYNFYP